MNAIVFMVGPVMVSIVILSALQTVIALMTFAKKLNVNLVLLAMVITAVTTMNVHGPLIRYKNIDYIIQT